MKHVIVFLGLGICGISFALNFSENFNSTNWIPKTWRSGTFLEGQKSNWVTENGVLRQKGYATYSYLVHPNTKAKDGFVEVRFNIEKGKEDPEAGLVWHFQDGKNYYYVRANSLENNIIFYRMFEGKKELVKEAQAEVKPQTWNSLKVQFDGDSIQVFLNSKEVLTLKDSKISTPGSFGVWTTADTQAAFDDLIFIQKTN